MSANSVKCWDCVKMDFGVEDGKLFTDYDFGAEDALEFEEQLAQARDVSLVEYLDEPLAIGSHIVISGTPAEDIPWFAVNIGCEKDVLDRDIAVHFNVRMPQRYVVRNTKKSSRWGQEQTTAFRLFPFKVHQEFKIEVLIDEKESYWAVDGMHYCNYVHRLPSPLNAVWVQIVGIRDATITIGVTDQFPAFAEMPREVPFGDEDTVGHDKKMWKPHATANLSQGIPEGHEIVIHGRLRPMLYELTIELLDRTCDWPIPNVLVHVSVRAYDESHRSRQLVVFNTYFGAWGSERRQRTAKLVPGTKSTFRIVRGPEAWMVYADDILIGELEYRASPEGVKALRIRGDLYPESIFICPTKSSSPPVESVMQITSAIPKDS